MQEKRRERNLPSERIHDVPKETTVEEIRIAIVERFNVEPLQISLHRNNENALFAVVTAPAALHSAMAATNKIRIGWTYCRLDTSVRVSRCEKCGLLGHPAKSCNSMDAPPAVDQAPDNCLDCSTYNNCRETSNKKSGFTLVFRKRPTNHRTGSSTCPTLRSMKKKQRSNIAGIISY